MTAARRRAVHWLLAFALFAFSLPLFVVPLAWLTTVGPDFIVHVTSRLFNAEANKTAGAVVAQRVQPCQSRVSTNIIVVECDGHSTAAQLVGLRVASPHTLAELLGPIIAPTERVVAPYDGRPNQRLECSLITAEPRAAESLATCVFGGADVALAILSSGYAVLSPANSASRSLLRSLGVEASYVEAERDAKLERRGVWWTYAPHTDLDSMTWHPGRESDEQDDRALSVSTQAWIAQALLLAGGAVAFFVERGRESTLEVARLQRLHNRLRMEMDKVIRASSEHEWDAALYAATSVKTLLESEGPSPEVMRRWQNVTIQVSARADSKVLNQYVEAFLIELSSDRSLSPPV